MVPIEFIIYEQIDEEARYEIVATETLCKFADKIRVMYGHIPFFSPTGEMGMDQDGWYEFEATVTENTVHVTFKVKNTKQEDNEEVYDFPMTRTEKRTMAKKIKNYSRNMAMGRIRR